MTDEVFTPDRILDAAEEPMKDARLLPEEKYNQLLCDRVLHVSWAYLKIAKTPSFLPLHL